MPNQTTILEALLPDPAGTNKALHAAEGIENLANAMAKIYELDVTGLTMPYELPYDPAEGGDKTGLHFMVLRLTGTSTAPFTIVVPNRDHMFVVENWTSHEATINVYAGSGPGTTVLANENRIVYSDADDVYVIQQFAPIEHMMIAATGEISVVVTGTNLVKFRAPYAFVLSKVKASLNVAQTGGSVLTVDVKASGSSIFSTLLTFDNNEKTTETATTPAVLSSGSFLDDEEITIDVTQVGTGTPQGLKLTFIGYRI